MRLAAVFAGVGVLAALAGTALWLGERAPIAPPATTIAPAAIFASSFVDATGQPQALGRFQGKLLVVNFWATWCAPCRAEMPAFSRLQQKWQGRNVQFVGLSSEEPATVASFAAEVPVAYPLWTGGAAVDQLSRRLGNHLGVLPHTVILDPTGSVLESKIGPYTEEQLESRLTAFASKRP